MSVSMIRERTVFVLSGKRKSGKDFVAEKLQNAIGGHICGLVRLSGPIKQQYAQEHGLDFQSLLSSGPYKEIYRDDMIKWGETRRNRDPGYFCRLATHDVEIFPVWIVTDARRKTDVEYFKKNFSKVILVRVEASDEVRSERGWSFAPGIDDVESECGLDAGIDWDHIIINNNEVGDLDNFEKRIHLLLSLT
ncbi:phosphomevalonate kinase-like isoform X1 [Clavelina lepadiformis]|uniref:phosphomevalonate kinase-like isoform X1 n=1 Tax=Clavelina lepadiformis TaxID=159417 RepID=UPI004040EB12